MARKRGKMALYEVMSKARAKSEQTRTVEPLQPKKKPEPVKVVKPVPVKEEIEIPEPQEKVNWRKKPRIVQYNLGRIEFSIPYQLAITAGLGLILLLLLAFRFGQFSSGSDKQPVVEPTGNSRRSDLTNLANPENRRTTVPLNEDSSAENRGSVPSLGDPDGTNVIVLAEHRAPTQLQPVKDYFMLNGIATQIVPFGNVYQLRTIDKFKGDPATPGTRGNDVLNKIKDIGKYYKAPKNYETFAVHHFSDAYGKIVEN